MMKAKRNKDQTRREAKKISSPLQLEHCGNNLFLTLGGLRIARRGHPGSRHAGTWVPIEPGWEVMEAEDGMSTLVRYSGASKH